MPNKATTDKGNLKRAALEDLLKELSSSESGLSDSEAEKRLLQYGYNEITEKKVNPVIKFLGYFSGPIPVMIEVAAILSAIIRHWEDFWIITALLVVNAVVGFWQEHKADNAIELLKRRLASNTRVLRNGQWREAPSKDLVPGDIVRVRLGDIVPADIKLMEGDYLLLDESALTGESLPVEKHVSDVAYSSSIVRQGEMNALVAATGTHTFFGKTAKLVEEAKTRSHFHKAVIKIGDYLIVIGIVLVALIFGVALYRHESLLQILQFALVLIVASIPVALPAVLSVTMAVGATALAAKEAIVSKLVSIEEMAGMDILCSDKTGTITKNELTLADVQPFGGFSEDDVLLYGALACRRENRDPIDDAIINEASSRDQIDGEIRSSKVTEFKPFDPVVKRTEAAITDTAGGHFRVTKGAPQVILALAADDGRTKSDVEDQVNELAGRGYRALGVARTEDGGTWRFVGLVPLFDPPREDSAETIKTAISMGVNVKMVTGDNSAIAKEIAGKVSLGSNIIRASAFIEQPEKEALGMVEGSDGFAEVFPEHKYHIVELLQKSGHIVGMTGDGVNDAPALKKADAGIAVSGATDAAKSAADIVLTKPGIAVIIDAIKESRKIFQRMNNYAIYRIAETIRVLLFMTLSIIVFNFYPVTAVMIVLLALLNDLPIMTISIDNVKYSNQPEKWNMSLLLGVATTLGVIGVISSFGIFYIGDEVLHLNREVLQSFIYLKLSVAGHMTLFVARTRGHFWSVKPAGLLFLAVIGTQLIATLIVVFGIILPPIGWKLALFVWVYAGVWFVLTDFVKLGAYKIFDGGLFGTRHMGQYADAVK
jgi:H+-transporting ATPase